MPKPEPARLALATYDYHFEMPPRFGDLDPLRHLNNAALARFYEEGRVRYINQLGLRQALEPGHGFVVGEVTIRYLAEGRWPDVVIVGSAVLQVGRSSFTIAQALFQRDCCIGVGEGTLVHVHRTEGGSRPFGAAALELLRRGSLREGKQSFF